MRNDTNDVTVRNLVKIDGSFRTLDGLDLDRVPVRKRAAASSTGPSRSAHVPAPTPRDTPPPTDPTWKEETMRTIESTATIHATATEIWEVLSAGQQYADWNPFITSVEGPLTVGSRPTLRIKPVGRNGMSFRPRVTHASPETGLRWKGRLFLPGLCDAEHQILLEQEGETRTRLVQRESFRGVLVPLLIGMLEPTRQGFDAMHGALGRRLAARRAS